MIKISPKNSKHKKKKTPSVEERQLYEELESYSEAGIALYLNGAVSDPKSIAQACSLMEESNYMRDYESGSDDGIYKITFNKVQNKTVE